MTCKLDSDCGILYTGGCCAFGKLVTKGGIDILDQVLFTYWSSLSGINNKGESKRFCLDAVNKN